MQIMCLSSGQFAKIILFPLLKTVGVTFVLLNSQSCFMICLSKSKKIALSQQYLDLCLITKSSLQ